MDERSKTYKTYESGICGTFPAPIADGSDETCHVEYVGEITDIFVLPYNTKVPVAVFKAKWVRPPDVSKPPSYRKDADGNLEVNFRQLLPAKVDPYVLPSSVEQVYFLNHDSASSAWKTVIRVEARSVRHFEISQMQSEEC